MTETRSTPPASSTESSSQSPHAAGTIPAGILGLGHYLPPRVMTNHDLEQMVDTTDEWIRTRTGIETRHIAEPGTPASALGVEAARKALDAAGVTPDELDFILVSTTCPDMFFPSTACMIQRELQAFNAAAMDMNTACAGFVYALTIAGQFVSTGLYRRVLVVASEVLSGFLDWNDRNTCVLFGDGAGACVVGPVESGGILGSHLGADGRHGDLLKIPAGGSRMPPTHDTIDQNLHTVKMEGSEIFKLAVTRMADATERVLADIGRRPEDVACVVPHQANKRIIDATAKRLGVDDSRVFVNVQRYGNMSSASTAVALSEAVAEQRITPGDLVILVAFGGGLVWGALALEWV